MHSGLKIIEIAAHLAAEFSMRKMHPFWESWVL